ncbi:hypothetical protein OG352_01510 [Streptomyces sp. NBC_01485]|nr:hypothetical protein [Streptomyces sp. NBC_01485]
MPLPPHADAQLADQATGVSPNDPAFWPHHAHTAHYTCDAFDA